MKDKQTYRITELANNLDLSPSTLRKYEDDFDLKIARNNKNHRYYTEKDVIVYKQILKMKEEGFSTDLINSILNKHLEFHEQQEESLDLIDYEQLTPTQLSDLFIEQFIKALKDERKILRDEYEHKLKKMREEIKYDLKNEISEQLEQQTSVIIDRIKESEETVAEMSLFDFIKYKINKK